MGSETHEVAVGQRQVDVLRSVRAREADPATEGGVHEPCAGDVVRMAMRVDRANELDPELSDERGVASMALEDGIDQNRLAGALVGQKVRVGARGLVEELTEDLLSRAEAAHRKVLP